MFLNLLWAKGPSPLRNDLRTVSPRRLSGGLVMETRPKKDFFSSKWQVESSAENDSLQMINFITHKKALHVHLNVYEYVCKSNWVWHIYPYSTKNGLCPADQDRHFDDQVFSLFFQKHLKISLQHLLPSFALLTLKGNLIARRFLQELLREEKT